MYLQLYDNDGIVGTIPNSCRNLSDFGKLKDDKRKMLVINLVCLLAIHFFCHTTLLTLPLCLRLSLNVHKRGALD
jgi:hypothetical protein